MARTSNPAAKKYSSYTGRNPKTGETVKIKPKKLPFFKVGKELNGWMVETRRLDLCDLAVTEDGIWDRMGNGGLSLEWRTHLFHCYE